MNARTISQSEISPSENLRLQAGFILTGVATVLIGPILPVLVARWSLNDAQAGLFFAVQFTGNTASTIFSGWVITHLGFGRSFSIGLAVMALGLGALGVAPWPLALLCVLAYGIGLGITVPTANLWVGERNPSRRAAALSWLNLSWGIGAVATPVLAYGILRNHTLPTLLVPVTAILIVLAFTFTRSRHAAQADVGVITLLEANRWLHRKLSVLLGLMFFLYVGTENAIGGWTATYARRMDLTSGTTWMLIPSLFWIALLAGRGLAPMVLRRISERALLYLALSTALAGISGILFARSMEALMAALLLSGLGCAAVFPLVMAMASHHLSRLSRRQAGPLLACGGFGGLTLPWLVGLISNHATLRIGLAVPWMAVAGMLILTGVVTRSHATAKNG